MVADRALQSQLIPPPNLELPWRLMRAVDIARENADLREEFLRRGMADADVLDRIGFVSHEDLDLWEDAGMLEVGALGLQEKAWGLGALSGDLFNRRIIRGRGGRFGGSIGGEIKPPKQSRLRVRSYQQPRLKRTEAFSGIKADAPMAKLSGRHGGVGRKHFKVFQTVQPSYGPGQIDPNAEYGKPERMSWNQWRQEHDSNLKVHAAGKVALLTKARKERVAGTKAFLKGDHEAARQHHAAAHAFEQASRDRAQTLTHGQQALYERRSAKLEKRIQRNVKRAGEKITPAAGGARGPNDLSAAEAHFNDAGRVSQKTLLAYAEEAARQPTTAEMYRNDKGDYHPSRGALHADIIDKMLRQHVWQGGKDRGLSSDTPRLEQPNGAPHVIFTGGGYAAGKGGILKRLISEGKVDKNTLILDPDLIKAELPEFQLAAMNDPEANLRVYSEAWDIAQEVMKEAQARGLNVVVDGITDTSPEEVAARVKSFTDNAGREGPKYINPEIYYVSVPTDAAISRAKDRAAKANTPSDRRMIPEVIMRAVHRDVSATMPGVMAKAKEMGAEVHVFDTDRGKDEATGGFNPAVEVAHASRDGTIDRAEPHTYQAILNKAQESIQGVPDVTVAPRGVWKTGGQDVSIDPRTESGIGKAITRLLPEEALNAPPRDQPTGGPDDPGALTRLAETKGLPAFKKLLDVGSGIVARLSGETHDISAGKDFKQVGSDVQNNMDKPHVIIAPVKSEERALAKAAANKHPNDLTQMHDAVRGTVTVPTAQELPGALDAITKEAATQGWTVERAMPRLVDAGGGNRATNGYGDTSLHLRGPKDAGNMLAELQVHTNPMWWNKEVGPGHAYYELERQISGQAQAQGRDMTPAEKTLIANIQKAAKPLYDRAWGASLNGGATGNVRNVVMGTKDEQARAAAELKGLQDQTHALIGATSQRARAA